MKSALAWLYVFGAVFIALLTNSISAVWAKGPDKFSIWLLLILLLSPLVFISFGLLTSKIGLAVTSGIVDSLLTLSTITVGLFLFNEWNKISFLQCIGMMLALCGIFLMLFFPRAQV